VSSGFNCVDLRQFYQPFGKKEYKQTKTGIALRLSEWETFKNVVVNLVQRKHATWTENDKLMTVGSSSSSYVFCAYKKNDKNVYRYMFIAHI